MERADAALRARWRALIEHNAKLARGAPAFGVGMPWFNVSRSLEFPRDFAGRVVLLEFWRPSSIDGRSLARDVEQIAREFAHEGFAALSVLSAKHPSEREVDHVRRALLRDGIEHPAVLDRAFEIGARFGVRAWPTLVLVSADGLVLGELPGDAPRLALDAMVGAALDAARALDACPLDALPLRVERTLEAPTPLRFPEKVLASAELDRLWISDTGAHRVVECTLAGRFLRAFGGGGAGLVDGPAERARFRSPRGLARVDGALIVADTLNHALRRIDLETGAVTTLAGDGMRGRPAAEFVEAATSRLDAPSDVLALGGEVAFALGGAHQLWTLDLDDLELRLLAGDGGRARLDGPGDGARFAEPWGLARAGDRLFVADSDSCSIRCIELDSRDVSTLAGASIDPLDLFSCGDQDGDGPGRRLRHPRDVAVDQGPERERSLVYVADAHNHRIKLLDPDAGSVASYAGDGVEGWRDGPCETARFADPSGLALAAGVLYVADSGNHAIRAVDLVAHEVRTLDLSSVPLPSELELAAFELDQPLPGGAQVLDEGPRRVKLPSSGAALEFVVELGPGDALAPLGASQFRVQHVDGLCSARRVTGRIESPVERVELGVAGDGVLDVQALAMVLDVAGARRLRARRWRLEVTLDERAPARPIALPLNA